MANVSKKSLEEKAARIRAKADILYNLPSPKSCAYSDAKEYCLAEKWNFDENEYNNSESYKADCEQSFQLYITGITAFNDVLNDIYSVLE